jgi:hypothetical protein
LEDEEGNTMLTKVKLTLVAVIGLIGGAFWVIGGDAQAQPVEFQATNMVAFKDANGEMLGPPFAEVDGTATLTRTKEGISYEIYTSGLEPGTYTAWTVIFNNPEGCDGPCNGPDLDSPNVNGSVVYGTGHIVGSDGIGNFRATLARGVPPAGVSVNVPHGTAYGLEDPMKAEIHLVLRAHGAPQNGLTHSQLTAFGGGCNNSPDLARKDRDDDVFYISTGVPGSFSCYEPQAAAFLSPMHDELMRRLAD